MDGISTAEPKRIGGSLELCKERSLLFEPGFPREYMNHLRRCSWTLSNKMWLSR